MLFLSAAPVVFQYLAPGGVWFASNSRRLFSVIHLPCLSCGSSRERMIQGNLVHGPQLRLQRSSASRVFVVVS